MMGLEYANDRRMQAFNHMLVQKNKVARAYNKGVRRKSFEEGDLVWNIILPFGSKDRK